MTDAGPLGVGWNGIIGGIVGCAMGVGVLMWLHWLREQRKDQRRERPPQPEKILRPAGYSAMVKLEELWDKIDMTVLRAIAASLMAGIALGLLLPVLFGFLAGRFTVTQLASAPKSHFLLAIPLFSIGAALWATREFLITARLYDQARNWRFGLRGEQAVAEKLSDRGLATAGYVVFHDLPAEKGKKKWNVDHVVVGPGGVFVLETKARPRRKALWDQEEHVAVFNGKVLRFPWCHDDRAVDQVQYNVRWVRQYLGNYAPDDLLIHPIIVVPGWYVPHAEEHPVKAMNATYLVGHLKAAKPVYSQDALKAVIQRLDDGCRTLEF